MRSARSSRWRAALWHLGKDVRIVNQDPAAGAVVGLSWRLHQIEVANRVTIPATRVIVMECGDLTRTGVEGLERGFVINIDHHVGNTVLRRGELVRRGAAACGEMVFDLVKELGVPLTRGDRDACLHRDPHRHGIVPLLEHLSAHVRHLPPVLEAGIDPPAIAGAIFDSNNLGRLKLFGAVLSRMVLDESGRVATICVDRQAGARVRRHLR